MKSFTDIKLRFIISLGGCGLICKYILIVFNIVFAVAGFASLVFGLWLHSLHNTKEVFDIGSDNDDDNKGSIELKVFNIAVYVLVTLGSIMAAMGIFGEYAACNGKKIALLMFSVLVFLLAVAEITVGALAYSHRHEVGKKLEDLYKDVHQLYVKNEDEAVATILTFLHSLLQCCGLTGNQHIELIKKTCQKLDDILEHTHNHSCSGRVGPYFESKAPLVLGFFIGTGVILIVEGICSSLLSSKIDQDATALE
ncbi:CD9 antigen [Fundulus heteroclitus]|uniref:CD9 antigen n=1 Tax=Fundulus heteroclitus TaxID=8078 RepID=UPI00165C7E08|nr:CD9 antigen [Fundulus heteroclitus]